MDDQLPEVIASAWRLIKPMYNLDDLTGPTDAKVLKWSAQKWGATAAHGENLVSIDLYVVQIGDGQIPNVCESIDSQGKKHFYYNGLGVVDNPTLAYRELTSREVAERLPGISIKVSLESLEPSGNWSSRVQKYRSDDTGIGLLATTISTGLEAMGLPKNNS